MRVYVVSSGSSGNLAIVEHDGERLVVDAGIGPKRTVETLRSMGLDLFPRGALGLVVTHDHDDHVAKLEPLARALKAPTFLHPGVRVPRVRARFPVVAIGADGEFSVGPFTVRTRTVPHDAPQVALRVEAGDRAFGWVTDLGHVPRTLPFFFAGCQTVLLEANYDRAMLEDGPYPPHLVSRVGGSHGHLDNEDAASLCRSVEDEGVERIVLGHLSAVNNTAAHALGAARRHVRRASVDVISHGGSARFDVGVSRGAQQLTLF